MKNTPDTMKFREMVVAIPDKSDLTVREIQNIYNAANNNTALLIAYAYAFGFERGALAAKKGKKLPT